MRQSLLCPQGPAAPAIPVPAPCPWWPQEQNSLPAAAESTQGTVGTTSLGSAQPSPSPSLAQGLPKVTPGPTELLCISEQQTKGREEINAGVEIISPLSHCTAGPAHIFHWKSFYLRDDEGRLTKVFMHHLNPGFQKASINNGQQLIIL